MRCPICSEEVADTQQAERWGPEFAHATCVTAFNAGKAEAAAEIEQLRADLTTSMETLAKAQALQAEMLKERAALAQPAAVSADAEDWLRERFGVVRGHPEWRALAEAFDAGKAIAQPAAPEWLITTMTADLLHLLQFATINTPTEGDAAQAQKLMRQLRAALAAAPHPAQTEGRDGA